MKRIVLALAGTAAAMAVLAGPAAADTVFEVEHARAIDRAGGPLSDLDVDLLKRYGATTGSRVFRHYYGSGTKYKRHVRRKHRRY